MWFAAIHDDGQSRSAHLPAPVRSTPPQVAWHVECYIADCWVRCDRAPTNAAEQKKAVSACRAELLQWAEFPVCHLICLLRSPDQRRLGTRTVFATAARCSLRAARGR